MMNQHNFTYGMKLCLILILHFCTIVGLSAQKQKDTEIDKNAIYLELESLLAIGNAAISYERVLNPEGKTHFGIIAGIGPGYFLYPGSSEHEPPFYVERGTVYKIKTNIFWNSGIKIGLGYSLMYFHYPGTVRSGRIFTPYDVTHHYPIVSIGYRSIGKPFLFKVQLGTWGLGLCFGYAF